MIVLGLTGSIGMGKSTAASIFREMGLPVHDADAEVHRLLDAGGGGVEPVGQIFPQSLKTGRDGRLFIDRPELGRLVFGDPEARRRLEAVLHPLVRRAADVFKDHHRRAGAELVVMDIPLLFETGGQDRVDVILCVTADPEVQRARVLARPGMTAEKFAAILARQMPDAEKVKKADFVLRSDKGLEAMKTDIQSIIRKLKSI